ncbi:unnamed protein product, partial [Rangifer tarandus platyrhynchus]
MLVKMQEKLLAGFQHKPLTKSTLGTRSDGQTGESCPTHPSSFKGKAPHGRPEEQLLTRAKFEKAPQASHRPPAIPPGERNPKELKSFRRPQPRTKLGLSPTAKPRNRETGEGACLGNPIHQAAPKRAPPPLGPRPPDSRRSPAAARRAPGRCALPALPARPERAPRAKELTAPLAQHPADLLLEVPARLERGEGGSKGGGRAAAAVGLGLHEEDVPAVLLEAPAGGEGGVAPGAQAHGEERVLLQAPGFRRPHLVHLHQIGRLGSGLGGAGLGAGGPGGHGPVGRRRALASPRPCLARGRRRRRRRLPVECPLLPPPRRVQLSLDHHRGALSQLLHRAHAGRGRVAHRGPRGSRLVAGGRPRRQGRGPQQQQRRQQQRRRRRRAGGGAGPPGAARGASPAHGA